VIASALELYRYRYLLRMLTVRELTVRYRQTILGAAWSVLLPLTMMAVFTFVFTKAVQIPSLNNLDVPYPLFALAGLVPWTFFAGSLNQCSNSLVANRNLVTKVYFPREVFPLSCVASLLVDFLIASAVAAGCAGYYALQGRFTPRIGLPCITLPIILGIQILLTVGAGLLLSMANLFYRDVRQALQIGIQLLMFVSAVVVPLPAMDTLWGRLLAWNPLVPLFSSYRDALLFGTWPSPAGLVYSAVVSVLIFLCGWAAFRRASASFAERI